MHNWVAVWSFSSYVAASVLLANCGGCSMIQTNFCQNFEAICLWQLGAQVNFVHAVRQQLNHKDYTSMRGHSAIMWPRDC